MDIPTAHGDNSRHPFTIHQRRTNSPPPPLSLPPLEVVVDHPTSTYHSHSPLPHQNSTTTSSATPSFYPLSTRADAPATALTPPYFDISVFNPFSTHQMSPASGPSLRSDSPPGGTVYPHNIQLPHHYQQSTANHSGIGYQTAQETYGHGLGVRSAGGETVFSGLGICTGTPVGLMALAGNSSHTGHHSESGQQQHSHSGLHQPWPVYQSQSPQSILNRLYGDFGDMGPMDNASGSASMSGSPLAQLGFRVSPEPVSTPVLPSVSQTQQQSFSTQNPYALQLGVADGPSTPQTPFMDNAPPPSQNATTAVAVPIQTIHASAPNPQSYSAVGPDVFLRIPFQTAEGETAMYNVVITSQGHINIPPGLNPEQVERFVRAVQIAYSQAAQQQLRMQALALQAQRQAQIQAQMQAQAQAQAASQNQSATVAHRVSPQVESTSRPAQQTKHSQAPRSSLPPNFRALQQAALGVAGGIPALPPTPLQIFTPAVPPVPSVPAIGMPTPTSASPVEQAPEDLPLTAPTPDVDRVRSPSCPLAPPLVYDHNRLFDPSRVNMMDRAPTPGGPSDASPKSIFDDREAFLAADRPLLVTIGDQSFNLRPTQLEAVRSGFTNYGYSHDAVMQADIDHGGTRDVHISLVVRFPNGNALQRPNGDTSAMDISFTDVEPNGVDERHVDDVNKEDGGKGKAKARARKGKDSKEKENLKEKEKEREKDKMKDKVVKVKEQLDKMDRVDEDERMDLDETPGSPLMDGKRKRKPVARTKTVGSTASKPIRTASDGPSKRTRRAQSRAGTDGKSPLPM